MEQKKTTTKRLDNLDLMKALAILAVVTLHTELWDTDFISHFSSGRIIMYACRLIAEGVPVFLAVNGYLLLKKEQLNLHFHIKKTVKILMLLFFWSAILTIVGNALTSEPEKLSIQMLLRHIWGTKLFADYTGVLWFLQFLIAIYVIYPLLWKSYKNDFKIYLYSFSMLAAFSVGPAILILIRDALALFVDASLITTLIEFWGILSPFGSIYGGFIWYLWYFMLGGILYRYEKHIYHRQRLYITVGLLSWIFELVYAVFISIVSGQTYNAAFPYNTGLSAIWVVGLFALTLPYQNKKTAIHQLIARIGTNTFGIYLCHYLFIFIYEKYWIPQTLTDRWQEFIIVFIMSYLLSAVLKKIPYAQWLITI